MTITLPLGGVMARRFNHLADVEAFIAVADNGSLSAAAV